MIKDKKIFITGGAGFIGSALVKKLIENNEVVVYDNYCRGVKRYFDNKILEIEGDVLDYELLREEVENGLFQDVQIIIHCAAIAGIDTVIKEPSKTMEVNLIGTVNLLKIAKEMKHLTHFVNFSTSEVYGPSAFKVGEGRKQEIGAVGEPRWSYALSKLAAEHFTMAYNREFDIPTTIIRPFNIYGEGQIGEGAIREFVLRAIKNELLEIYGDGTHVRSWCYISDMVDAILLCLNNEEAIGRIFNIGNPRATITTYNLARMIIEVANSNSEIKFVATDKVDVAIRVPDILSARTRLGFRPKVNLEEGLRKTIAWYSEDD